MAERLAALGRALRATLRAGSSLAAGILLGLVVAFGVVVPVFQRHPVVIAAPGDGMTPSTAGWQRLLDDYLMPLRQYDTDRTPHVAATRFDYRALLEAPAWPARLDSVRRELLAVPPSALRPADRMAWALDTYNFLVVDRVAHVLAARPAGGPPLTSVREVKDFFDAPVVEVEGRSYSLGTFEHHFVWFDVDRDEGRPLPAGLDPRAHFALTTASIGGPPLWPDAYRGATLSAQLDSVTRAALHSPAHLRWDPVRRTLELSELFAWFDHDFGGPAGVMDFVTKHAPDWVSKDLDRFDVGAPSGSIPWDWTLDQRP